MEVTLSSKMLVDFHWITRFIPQKIEIFINTAVRTSSHVFGMLWRIHSFHNIHFENKLHGKLIMLKRSCFSLNVILLPSCLSVTSQCFWSKGKSAAELRLQIWYVTSLLHTLWVLINWASLIKQFYIPEIMILTTSVKMFWTVLTDCKISVHPILYRPSVQIRFPIGFQIISNTRYDTLIPRMALWKQNLLTCALTAAVAFEAQSLWSFALHEMIMPRPETVLKIVFWNTSQ
jgi:hypothetical protein